MCEASGQLMDMGNMIEHSNFQPGRAIFASRVQMCFQSMPPAMLTALFDDHRFRQTPGFFRTSSIYPPKRDFPD
jgi:hypothetical protein